MNKTKTTRGRAKVRDKYGVWIPCESKPDAEAKLYGLCYHNHQFYGWATVRKLPAPTKARK